MGTIDDPLWSALADMRIAPRGASLTFTKRLARDNGWSRKYAEAVVVEYKRFLYLAATGSDTVTPSEQVDQAWHLHLSYTRHYWGELCAHIIGRPLHHGPTAGGGAEGRKYRRLYAATLDRYRSTFGAEPPADIWPPVGLRFAGSYQWVDRSRHFVLPRRRVSIAGMAAGATLLAACTALAADSASVRASPTIKTLLSDILSSNYGFVAFVVLLFVALVVIANIISRLRGQGSTDQQSRRKRRIDSGGGSGSDAISDSWTGSGSSAAAAGGAAFAAGGGEYGGGGASGDWDNGGDSGGDSGGGDSGCGGGCGGA